MDNYTLLPCAHCGGEGRILSSTYPTHVFCTKCSARTVGRGFLEDGVRQAVDSWNARYVEPNRILTLAEAQSHVEDPLWFEYKNKYMENGWALDYDHAMRLIYSYDVMSLTPEEISRSESREMAEEGYEREWRTWLRRPTDEERAAMEWKKEWWDEEKVDDETEGRK